VALVVEVTVRLQFGWKWLSLRYWYSLEKLVMEDAKLCTRLPPGPGRNEISGGIAGMGGVGGVPIYRMGVLSRRAGLTEIEWKISYG
jgi:hypothetical protein